MALAKKYKTQHKAILRDNRSFMVRLADTMEKPSYSATVFIMSAVAVYMNEWALALADIWAILLFLYFLWLYHRDRSIAFKLPMGSKYKDSHNKGPGRSGKAEGILYLGNADETNEEVWFTNSDARTHILYLGTTGSGKTVGLTSMVTNALSWSSGFVYVDGKADTDLWSNLSSLARRFGRDDDLMVLNYMTGNTDGAAPSHTMNPFSSGSASYLTNMLVSLMPEAQGDNAMWSERAISLVSAMMPVLTWKRDNQDMPLSVRSIRDNLSLNNVVKLARDEVVPEHVRSGLKGYLDTLPGFVHSAFDDDGQIKPPEGGGPPPDTQTASQQHGYLAMQFTRSLQSLGDDYGYIFDTQAADVDMVDIVLNRRILVVLIPALEKSNDEIANLGKIVAATMKGMMGSTLGATVEGSSETVIENKPTHSSTPFMTVFDEVGYYTAEGMAVMAAQARSLGFCLVFSGQDLPAMKKRVREEANSITANCNIKIFGKLEDPTETKEFFEKTVGDAFVTEVSGFQISGAEFGSYKDNKQASIQSRAKASYDELRSYSEGEAIVTFGENLHKTQIFYSNPGHAKAMRITRFMALPKPDDDTVKYADSITALRDLLVNKGWTAARADIDIETPPEIKAMKKGIKFIEKKNVSGVEAGIAALIAMHGLENDLGESAAASETAKTPATKKPENTVTKTPDTKPTQEPVKTDPTASAHDQPNKDPLAFFKTPGADTGKETTQQESSQTTSTAYGPDKKPVQEADKETGKTEAPVPKAKAEPAEAKLKPVLPPEILSIVENAAKEARAALFKDKEKDKSGPVDATE